MTWGTFCGYGGETQQSEVERLSAYLTSAVTVDATGARIVDGVKCVKFPTNADNSRAILSAVGSSISGRAFGANIFAFSGSFGLSTTPGSNHVGILSNGVQGGRRYLLADDSNKVRLYDKSGNLIRTSDDTISTSGMTHVCLILDGKNSAFALAFLWIGGKLQAVIDTGISPSAFFDSGDSWCWGEYTPASSGARGADLFGDSLVCEISNYQYDSPLYGVPYPKFHIIGGPGAPVADGTYTAWALTGDTNTWKCVDDLPDDGATTELASVLADGKFSVKSDTNFAVPTLARIRDLQQSIYLKIGTAGKLAGVPLHLLAGAESHYRQMVDGTTPGTAYGGDRYSYCERPGAPDFSPAISVRSTFTTPGGGVSATLDWKSVDGTTPWVFDPSLSFFPFTCVIYVSSGGVLELMRVTAMTGSGTTQGTLTVTTAQANTIAANHAINDPIKQYDRTWVPADFTQAGSPSRNPLEFGYRTFSDGERSGVAVSCRVTQIMAPQIIYSLATEDLPVPIPPALGIRRDYRVRERGAVLL